MGVDNTAVAIVLRVFERMSWDYRKCAEIDNAKGWYLYWEEEQHWEVEGVGRRKGDEGDPFAIEMIVAGP